MANDNGNPDFRVDMAPHSAEAEQAVLGSVLVDASAIYEVPFLSDDDFFFIRHGWIWKAMVNISSRRDPLDYLTIVSELEQSGQLAEVGGAAYILSLINASPYAYNVEGYGRIVERLAVRRRLIDAAGQVAKAAHSEMTEIEEVINTANSAVSEATDRHVATISKARSIDDVVADVQLEACQWRDDPRDVRGLATGFYPLDMATGGFEPGLVYEIAARPGMGKSALIADVVRRLGETGISVVLISLEMSDRAMVRRMAIQKSKIDATALKQGKLSKEEFARFMAATDDIGKLKDRILIENKSGLSILGIQSVVSKFSRRHEVGLVIIDTMNRVCGEGGNAYEKMTMVSHSIADWAHNSPFAILCAVQLSRVNQKMSNKRPTQDALRDSGAVEEDADWIGGIHREWAYANTEEEKAKLRAEGKEHLAELLILKNRDGDPDAGGEMYWSGKSLSFERIEHTRVDLNPGMPRPPKSYVLGRDDPGLQVEAAR